MDGKARDWKVTWDARRDPSSLLSKSVSVTRPDAQACGSTLNEAKTLEMVSALQQTPESGD
jgi:hypothetical protein